MIYILLFLLIVGLLILALGMFMVIGLVYIKKRPDISLEGYTSPYLDEEHSLSVREWLDSIKLEKMEIVSPYGYKLNAAVIEGKERKRWIFLLHGVTQNHKYMLDIASFYHKAGYSVIIWDSRGHGESGGRTTTYGLYEKFDLKAVLETLRKKYGDDIRIGLHGLSMGSGILLQYASYVRDDCEFYISDCSFSYFPDQVTAVVGRKIRSKGLPVKVVFETGNLLCRILFRFDTKKIDIASKIHRLENPLLFFNCRDDDYINPVMTKELHEAARAGINEIIWYDEGGHGQ